MPKIKSPTAFGWLIKVLRISHGWSQKELAEKLQELSNKTKDWASIVSTLEQGEREPKTTELCLIPNALKVPVSWLHDAIEFDFKH